MKKNDEKPMSYVEKAKESGGFDVGCGSRWPGGIVPIQLTSDWWEIAGDAAEFAVVKRSIEEGTELRFKALVKANMQGIAGLKYYLTLTAVDPTDEAEKVYRAIVTDTPWKPYQERLCLISFEIFTATDKTAEEMRLEIDNNFKKLAKKGFRRPYSEICDYHDPTHRELAVKGFYMHLKEFRNENPRWKYATARRIASRKWKSLNSIERHIYELRAREEFVDKQKGVQSSHDTLVRGAE